MSMIDPKCSSPMINGSGSCTRDLPIATVKGEVKGCEEKQFELLMVLINWRSHLTWFDFEHSYTVVRTLPTLCYLFWRCGRRCHSFHYSGRCGGI
jgi:hypothetical protein